jgi:ribonuclease-3
MTGKRRNPYRDLEKQIGYKFRKRKLLEAALTHRSFRFENEEISQDNQRLEFLGDAALGFLTAVYVYQEFDERDEGFLTSLRSRATSGRTLASIAVGVDLGRHLKIGKGEKGSGGRRRPSNLADALEAITGAAFLDGGMKAAEKVFKKLVIPLINSLSHDVWDGNPKGKLQEYAQRRWKKGPHYRLVHKEGPQHSALFTVQVVLPDGIEATGQGKNKQNAEAQAAHAALEQLGVA